MAPNDRNYMLSQAINEMNYTDEHSKNDLDLKWRMLFHQEMGNVYLLLKDFQKAGIEFKKVQLIQERIKR
jgi:hypothetical protein